MTEEIQHGQPLRRGFGLKDAVQIPLAADYHSQLIRWMVSGGHTLSAGELTIRLAKEFGFCYGVDRAVDLAYETLARFPDRRIFLTNEIIHNPRVNGRLRELGIQFLSDPAVARGGERAIRPEDVVVLPAFGVPVPELERLKATHCILVDSTCGSVMAVWRRVEQYAKLGFTSIIHGKAFHEETRATSSRALQYPGAHFLIVLDREQARSVCRFIVEGGDREAFLERFRGAYSPGFDPARDLERVGCANQTTMLSSESLEIAEEVRRAMATKYGEPQLAVHFMTYDTICTATQDRQDAMAALLREGGVDGFLIVGGFNSSNTGHLAEMAIHARKPAYHIEDASCLISPQEIRHKRVAETVPVVAHEAWLPSGRATLGITSGASTPNRILGTVIERVLSLRGVDVAAVLDQAQAAVPPA